MWLPLLTMLRPRVNFLAKPSKNSNLFSSNFFKNSHSVLLCNTNLQFSLFSTTGNSDKVKRHDETQVFTKLYNQISVTSSHKLALIKKLKEKYSDKVVSTVNVTSILGGLRGVLAMITETSQIDADKGILIQGLSVPEMLEKLPKPKNGIYPYTESIFWLLLTGNIPTEAQSLALAEELFNLSKVPKHIYSVLDALPTDSHPMMQYVVAVSALQTESLFTHQYSSGEVNKNTCWKAYLHDSLSLMAKSLPIVAYIYNRTFLNNKIRNGEGMELDPQLDFSSNLSKLMKLSAKNSDDMLRLYLALHSDHEGGNVSAHTAHIIASALADPFLSVAGMLSGLSGPFHGLANQECIKWLKSVQAKLGGVEPTPELVVKITEDTLASGQVVPGYGHAVLRITDPRHDAMFGFITKFMRNEPIYKLLSLCVENIPKVLKGTNKIKSPYPNVDCCSGVMMEHFGITQFQFYTVLFGLSRSMGVLAQIVWARVLRMPIDRPKSITLEHLRKLLNDV